MAGVLDALSTVRLGDAPPDLSVLRDVPGHLLPRRRRGRAPRPTASASPTSTRSRRPTSPGLLDAYGEAHEGTAIIETNRGCPYGCTFCDWGSATLSRIRKFDLERVFAELEWCARNGSTRIGLADANFGIFERDVDIAEKIAELKAQYGYPKMFGDELRQEHA